MDGARLERRVQKSEEMVVELPVKAVISADGLRRINPPTFKAKCRVSIDATIYGLLLTDPVEMKLIGQWQTGYDVILSGPPRPGLRCEVHSRNIVPLEEPPTVLPGLG